MAALEAQLHVLKAQMQEMQHLNQDLTAKASQGEEAGELRTLLSIRDAENDRLKAAPPVDAGRLSRLESENTWLRAQLAAASSHRGNSQPSSSPPMSPLTGPRPSPELGPRAEGAAWRLQRAVRRWLATRPPRRRPDGTATAKPGTASDDSGAEARDRFKRALREVEEAVDRAVESANCQEMGHVPRLTRLEILLNALKQGVVKVTQAKNLQTLQEMRRPAAVLPPVASGAGSSTSAPTATA